MLIIYAMFLLRHQMAHENHYYTLRAISTLDHEWPAWLCHSTYLATYLHTYISVTSEALLSAAIFSLFVLVHSHIEHSQ